MEGEKFEHQGNFRENEQFKFFLECINDVRETYPYALRPFTTIKLFCEIFNLDWYVL